MKRTSTIVKELKQWCEDFEFYPTTTEIVEALKKHLKYEKIPRKVLDIGCGNGSFFEKFCNCEEFKYITKYGIEKSDILAANLPDDIVLLGSDFHEQTLIDKKVDMIFCNPPYSEFEIWTEKIIKQGNAEKIALVIPSRWKNNEKLIDAIEKRKFKYQIIGTYDFLEAERKARATVDLIVLTPAPYMYQNKSYDNKPTDPFDLWFEETFKIDADKNRQYETSYRRETEENLKNEIIQKGDTAEMLVEFYNKDMEKLYRNYRKLEELDYDLLKELKIDIPGLKAALKERLQGLKHIYWDLLFKKYDKLTSRLTSTGREKVINRLNDNTAIDFTLKNIVQLTVWMIKHSNTLFDEQITEYFFSLCNTKTIHRYKSNKRWNEDDWRYIKDTFDETKHFYGDDKKERMKKAKYFQLDYRIVVKGWRNFEYGWGSNSCRIDRSAIEFVQDTLIIAENLGFKTQITFPDKYETVKESDWNDFDVYTTDGKLFANIKLYKNGNRHVKFCKEFMQKLNVEMARINGWVQNKTEAMKEMDLSEQEINSIWKSNFQVGIDSGVSLLGLPSC